MITCPHNPRRGVSSGARARCVTCHVSRGPVLSITWLVLGRSGRRVTQHMTLQTQKTHVVPIVIVIMIASLQPGLAWEQRPVIKFRSVYYRCCWHCTVLHKCYRGTVGIPASTRLPDEDCHNHTIKRSSYILTERRKKERKNIFQHAFKFIFINSQ